MSKGQFYMPAEVSRAIVQILGRCQAASSISGTGKWQHTQNLVLGVMKSRIDQNAFCE
jgi:hypothetical protein